MGCAIPDAAMKRWVTHIWVVLLTGMLVLSLGLRGLAAPCQNGHCGTGGCATSATPCPPSCTCHLSQSPDGDRCCHSAKTPPAGHGASHHGKAGHAPDHPGQAQHPGSLGQHHGHGAMPPKSDPTAANPTANQAHHHAPPGLTASPDRATGAHCAPSAPQPGEQWPNLSLPHVQAPALLAAALALDLPLPPPPESDYQPWLAARPHAPPHRPPAA
jgi:hypothetical protein